MRRHATVLRTALAMPITAMLAKCNPVMRVGALSEGQSEKAALDSGCALTDCSKIQIHKVLRTALKLSNVPGVDTAPPVGSAGRGYIRRLEP